MIILFRQAKNIGFFEDGVQWNLLIVICRNNFLPKSTQVVFNNKHLSDYFFEHFF